MYIINLAVLKLSLVTGNVSATEDVSVRESVEEDVVLERKHTRG